MPSRPSTSRCICTSGAAAAAISCAPRVSTIGAIARCLQMICPPATPCPICTTRSFRASSADTALAVSSRAAMPRCTRRISPSSGWWPAARHIGAIFPRRCATACRWHLAVAVAGTQARRAARAQARLRRHRNAQPDSDWMQVGRGRRTMDLEQALGQLRVPIRAVTLARDTVGPAGALRALLDKMPQAHAAHVTLDDRQLGTRSDHFAWMKTPAAVVATLRSASDDAINGDRISQRD